MLVPVRSSLLMVEAQCVEHLVLDNLSENAAPAIQRHNLTPSLTTNKRVAPKRKHTYADDPEGHSGMQTRAVRTLRGIRCSQNRVVETGEWSGCRWMLQMSAELRWWCLSLFALGGENEENLNFSETFALMTIPIALLLPLRPVTDTKQTITASTFAGCTTLF